MNFLTGLSIKTWALIASYAVLAGFITYIEIEKSVYKKQAEKASTEVVRLTSLETVYKNSEKQLVESLNKQSAALNAIKEEQEKIELLAVAKIEEAQKAAKTAQERADRIMRKKPVSVATQCNDAADLFDGVVYEK